MGELKIEGKYIERLVLRPKNGRTQRLEHPAETIKLPDGLKQRLASIGLHIPPDYVFESKGEMKAKRFGRGEGSGQTWCEGEVFRFVREFDNKVIANDTCVVAIRNADVILYNLKNHPIKKVGTQRIRKPALKKRIGGIETGQVNTKLVYEVKGNAVVPVWHAEYGDYLLKYDAITGDTYREK
ncbi:MAG: hypothetical protein HQ580_20015 [Planctomycetes bacterium]|nr:hypothetical protein [Planctomycetota bacterium]